MRKTLTRRHLLTLIAVAPVIGAVGCTEVQAAAWLAALQTLSQLFVSVEPELEGEGYNPAAPITVTVGGVKTTTTVSGIAALVQQVVTALGNAASASQGQSALITIETYVNALVPVIYPVVLPFIAAATPGGGFAIGLIIANLPAIEAALNFEVNIAGNLVKTLLTPQAQALAVLAPPGQITKTLALAHRFS